MQNVDLKVKGDKLTITIDLSKDFGPSKSGKTISIASTKGNQTLPDDKGVIGLNVYRYPNNGE